MSDNPNDYPVKRPWTSMTTLLIVQAQNAFNDNFLKFVLISLAAVVASGSWLGEDAKRIFSASIPLAFILFSPLAGFLSDRFSKRNVIFWCVVAQISILFLTIFGLGIHNIWITILALFLLSIQSAFFSPSKTGIMKELVGSKKLTTANGLLQMFTMLAILAGIGLGGGWFGAAQQSSIEEWKIANPGSEVTDSVKATLAWGAARFPIMVISIAALVPLLMKLFIDPTPAHISKGFEPSIFWKHFSYLKELFNGFSMTRTAVGISYYWLLASFLGVLFFEFGETLYPGGDGRASTESSKIAVIVGVGIMLGSLLVALISRDGIKLKLAPIGGIGMSVGIVIAGIFPPGEMVFYIGMAVLGLMSGFFIVPLTTFLQDISANEKRGRIMSASALVTSMSGLIAIGISQAYTWMGVHPSRQLLYFVVPTLLVTWYIAVLVKRSGALTEDVTSS